MKTYKVTQKDIDFMTRMVKQLEGIRLRKLTSKTGRDDATTPQS